MNGINLTLDLRDDLFILNEATLEALGRPQQVQLLINTQKRKLVLRACSTEDAEAIFLPTEQVVPAEISGRKLIQNIRRNMGWNDKETRICPGIYFASKRAVCFDLNRSRIA